VTHKTLASRIKKNIFMFLLISQHHLTCISFWKLLQYNCYKSGHNSLSCFLFKTSFRRLDSVRLQALFQIKDRRNVVFWDVMPWHSYKTEDSEERRASIIKVTKFGELGTTLAVTSISLTLQRALLIRARKSNVPEDAILEPSPA
jgi:hypothetical protein